MDRREAGKKIKDGLIVLGTIGLSFPFSKSLTRSSLAGDYEPEERREDLENKAILNLKDKYNIPTDEQAKKLYKRILNERAIYYTTGAVTGSAYRASDNVVKPNTRRNFFKRAQRVLAGGGAGLVTAWAANDLAQPKLKSSLINSTELINEYGLPAEDAIEFSKNYRNALENAATAGGVTAVLIQDFLIKPTVKAETVQENNLEAD